MLLSLLSLRATIVFPRQAVLVAAGLAVMAAAPADAALVAVDYAALGDAKITRDTANGLDWLDWTVTSNISFDDMVANRLTLGGEYAGWRHATTAELSAFMASGGVPDLGGRTSANIPTVMNIISLLGANDLYDFLGAGNSTAALLAGDPGGTGPFAVFAIETFDNPLTAKAGQIGVSSHSATTRMGHALLRESTSTPAIPEPSAAALLAMASGLGLIRRRRILPLA